MELFNDDCFNIFPKLEKKSIDMVLVDLPYSQTSCKWDIAIDLDKMWIDLKRVCKKKCVYVFFCSTKFGYTIIKSNPKWFRYDLVWEKSRKVGFLSANRMPLRKHEMVYIFGEKNNEEWNLPKEKYIDLKTYSKYLISNLKITDKKLKNLRFFKPDLKDFCLMREKTYNQLIKDYKIDKLDNFKTFIELRKLWNIEKEETKKKDGFIYNSQKTKGKPYKTGKRNVGVYGNKKVDGYENKTGDRHPNSILQFPSHEMMYVFGKNGVGKKTYNPQKVPGKPYKTKEHKSKKSQELYAASQKIIKAVDNKGTRHPTSILNFEEQHEMIYVMSNPSGGKKTYNPQKVPGKPYTHKKTKQKDLYGVDNVKTINTGDRHPTTILKFNNPKKSQHRTQKPVDLCEWLIKSYSNEGDVILDFTMGSGTTGLGCLNTNRKFIGIEMDKEIFKLAKERLKLIS